MELSSQLVDVIVNDDTTSNISITSLIKMNDDVKVLITMASTTRIIRPRIIKGDTARLATVSKNETIVLLIVMSILRMTEERMAGGERFESERHLVHQGTKAANIATASHFTCHMLTWSRDSKCVRGEVAAGVSDMTSYHAPPSLCLLR